MKSRRLIGLAVAVVSAAALSAQAPAPAQTFDLIIRNGRVFDGTGNPWFPADIGVREGRIVAVGRLADAKAARISDATGKYVSPGFIDIHSHADDGSSPRGGFRDENPQIRAAPNLVTQGHHDRVDGNDGSSPLPLAPYLARAEAARFSPNLALFVGHGTIRERVMGTANRKATPGEIERMQALLA